MEVAVHRHHVELPFLEPTGTVGHGPSRASRQPIKSPARQLRAQPGAGRAEACPAQDGRPYVLSEVPSRATKDWKAILLASNRAAPVTWQSSDAHQADDP